MRNYVQEGDILDCVAPSGGVTSGVGYVIENMFVVSASTALEGEDFAGVVEGVVELASDTGTGSNQGVRAYWDATNKRVTATATGNTKIGVYAKAKASADTTARVKLVPQA